MSEKQGRFDQKRINQQLFVLNEKLHHQLRQQAAQMDTLQRELAERVAAQNALLMSNSMHAQMHSYDEKIDKIQKLIQHLDKKIENVGEDNTHLNNQNIRNAELIALLEVQLKEWVAKAVDDVHQVDQKLVAQIERVSKRIHDLESQSAAQTSRFDAHLASLQTDMDQLTDAFLTNLTNVQEQIRKGLKSKAKNTKKAVLKSLNANEQTRATASPKQTFSALLKKARRPVLMPNIRPDFLSRAWPLASVTRPAMAAVFVMALFAGGAFIVPKFMEHTTIQTATTSSGATLPMVDKDQKIIVSELSSMPPRDLEDIKIDVTASQKKDSEKEVILRIPVFESNLTAPDLSRYLRGSLNDENYELVTFALDKALSNYAFDETLPNIIMQLQADALTGHPDAQHDLGMVYIIGAEGVQPNAERAAFWFQQAALRKHPNAQYNLGVLYGQGLGVNTDDNLAFFWYQESARTGHPQAVYNVGVSYAEGVGVARDLDKAQAHFIQAAQGDVPHASYYLGLFYEDGILGTPETQKEKAIEWYQKALAQGFGKAGEALARLDPTGTALDNIMPASGMN